jgi:hypothetical protein
VLLALSVLGVGEAEPMRVVVADLPYRRVWDAAVRAVEGYPIERAGDGLLVTGWLTRAARDGEAGYSRVLERVTLRVEPFAERITRVTVEVEVKGLRNGEWVPIADTEPAVRWIIGRLREGPG